MNNRDIAAVYASYEDPRVAERWNRDNAGNCAIIEERRRLLRHLLNTVGRPLNELRVLDVGCGDGTELSVLHSWGIPQTQLWGVELLPGRAHAAASHLPNATIIMADVANANLSRAAFDVVMLNTVFSSVLEARDRLGIALACARVLRPGGVVICYDMRVRNPYNPNVRPLSRKALRTLFPEFASEFKTLTVLPPLVRRLGPATRLVYPLLSLMPLLRTHLFAVLTKPELHDGE